LQNKVNCSSVLKEVNILEAVHCRFEHYHCNNLCVC